MAWHRFGTWSGVGQEKKALEAEMRSSVIVLLFLFSMLFLGAQAAQMGPPKPLEEAASSPAQHADAGMLQSAAFSAGQAD
jgi:hypothetical protein